MNIEKRRNKFEEQVKDLWIRKETYCKEKWWRFDCEYYWNKPKVWDRLIKIERDSELCCMKCWEMKRQYWTNDWWIRHYCLKCYIIHYIPTYIKWKFRVFKCKLIRKWNTQK